MRIHLFKLNGWPDTYDERIRALSKVVDISFIRTAPLDDTDDFDDLGNVTVYNVYPRRGSHVSPSWLKPIVFILHVFQAFLISIFISIKNGRPDVIHALDYVLGGAAAATVALILHRPFIASVRGYKEPIYRSIVEERQTVRARINYYILVAMSKIILSQADHVITKANYQRNAVKNVVKGSSDFSTIPTGVDFERFKPSSHSRSDYLSELFPNQVDVLSRDSLRVLYLGQIAPQKGVDLLLEHIQHLPDQSPKDVNIIIVGDYQSKEYYDKVKNIAEDVPYPVLIHSEQIPFNDVPDLLSSVDIVTLLSKPNHEGVPRVLQEACAMQVPIIASDVTGISGAFTGLPGCELIERGDVDSFSKALRKIHEEDHQMDRDIFRDHFDIYENYNKYEEIYSQNLKFNRSN